MIPNVKPYIPEEDIPRIMKDLESILRSRKLILGPHLREFEKQFREYVGTSHAIGIGSAGTALHLLYQFFDVAGKEVVMPSLNFITVANAVLFAGGKPVFCDTAPQSLLPSLESIMKAVTDQTRGIVLVHITGHINPEQEAIKSFCHKKNLFLIEDCSHAHGSEVNGFKAGNLCDAAVFSFYPTKVMTTGTGGMITTNTKEISDYAHSARHHGQGESLMDCQTIGGGWVMTEMAAVLGKYQLCHLEEWVQKRNVLAQRYDTAFASHPNIELLKPVGRSAYYKYQILLKNANKKNFLAAMKKKEITCGEVYNPPIHLQPVYNMKFGYKLGMFPCTEDICSRLVALPIFVEMTEAEQDMVISAVQTIL